MKITKTHIAFSLIALLSIAVPVIVWVLQGIEDRSLLGHVNVAFFPPFHAVLNSLTFICLLLGFLFIKRRNIPKHKLMMFSALILSVIFLISYVVYHYKVPPTHFGGDGWIKLLYYFILTSHIVLAAVVEPLALLTVYWTLTNQLSKHRKWARITLPIWLYVSFTGVMVYLFMIPYY